MVEINFECLFHSFQICPGSTDKRYLPGSFCAIRSKRIFFNMHDYVHVGHIHRRRKNIVAETVIADADYAVGIYLLDRSVSYPLQESALHLSDNYVHVNRSADIKRTPGA